MQETVASCYPTECVTGVASVRAVASGLGAMVQDSMGSEVAALRREVSTLRVADSQHEVQHAEVTRHVREVQASIRQEFETRLEVASQAQERSMREHAAMQEELAKVVQTLEVERRERNVANERAHVDYSELRALIGEDKAFLQQLKVHFEDEMKIRSTKVDVDLQNLASDLNERNASCEVSLKRTVVDTSEQVLQDVRCLLVQHEKNLDAALRKALTDEAANRKADLALVTADCAGLRSMLEQSEARMREKLNSLSEELRTQGSEFGSLVSNLTGGSNDRFLVLNEALEKAAAEHRSTIQKFEELQAKSDAQRASDVDVLKGSVEALDTKYFRYISEHRQLLDNAKDRWEDQLNRKHNFLNDRLAELELKVKSSNSQLSEDQGSQQASLLELEQRLQNELSTHGKELQERFLELKDLVGNESSERNHFTGNLESSVNVFVGQIQREVADHRRYTERQHDALRDNMSKVVEDRHSSLLERLEEADRRADSLPKNSSVEGRLSNLERKLHDEMMSQFHEHRGNHQELQDQVARLASEHASKQMELNGLIGRMSMQDKSARDEQREHVNGAIDALDQKLRRELSRVDELHGSMREQLGQESKVRERTHAAIHEKVEEMGRQSRDAQALEMRKLREELMQIMDSVGGKHFDFKDMLAKASADSNERYTEIKETFGRLLAQEKSAREELRGVLVGADDAVVAKLRREMEEMRAVADRACTALHEQLVKDRRDQDGQCASLSTSIGALERRCREELQARVDELLAIVFELKEGTASMAKSESAARDELRQGVLGAVEALEVKMRRELVDDSALRERIEQEAHYRLKAASELSDRLTELQRKYTIDLAQEASKQEATAIEVKEFVVASCSQESFRIQEMLIKEAEARTSLEEYLVKQVGQEKAAREVQQETLRVYLAQDRAAREAPVVAMQDRIEALERARSHASKDAIGRTEFEGVLRRVWEVVDSHSYTLAKTPDAASATREGPSVVQAVQQIPMQMVQIPQQKSTILVSPVVQPVATMAAGYADMRTVAPAEVQAADEALRMRSQSPMFRSRSGSQPQVV